MNIGAVAIPVSGLPTWELMNSIVGLRSPAGFRYMTVGEYRRPKPIDRARNTLVQMFLEDKRLEWLLFVDSDAVLHPETLNRLLSWDVPIVSALCFTRSKPIIPSVYGDDRPHGGVNVKIQETMNWLAQHPNLMAPGATLLKDRPDDALLLSNCVGMHTTLIRREVLAAMEPPYFLTDTESEKGAGEDFYFCRKANAIGFNAYVDMSVISGHQAMVELAGLDFHAWGLWMAQREEYINNGSV